MIHKTILLFLFLLSFPFQAFSTTYEVGPGKTFAKKGDVSWENKKADDQVSIHWRQRTYREKWVIAVEGTQQQPFVVRGVPNAKVELPVIDSRNATTRSKINFYNESRGVIKIGGANSPAVGEPTWIVITNLDIRNGRPPYQFTERRGLTNYSSNAVSATGSLTWSMPRTAWIWSITRVTAKPLYMATFS